MSKKFVAQRSRDAAQVRKTVESTVAVSTIPEDRRAPTHKDRERTGLERVGEFMRMSLSDLEIARIEHLSAILGMDLQMGDPSPTQAKDHEWAERVRSAQRHRKVDLAIIENVISLKRECDKSRAEFFMAAAMKLFDRQDLDDTWAAAKAIAPGAACWAQGE